jgi:hypothetical protein
MVRMLAEPPLRKVATRRAQGRTILSDDLREKCVKISLIAARLGPLRTAQFNTLFAA